MEKITVKLIIFGALALGFVTTFVGGFILSRLLIQETVLPLPEKQSTTQFLPGKQYFEDTVMLITKDEPRRELLATVTRHEQTGNYSQSTRVSYFSQGKWTRQIDSQATTDSTIVSSSLLSSWQTKIDPSRVLRQTVEGAVTLEGQSLGFATEVLHNEIGMRSLPGYTKFMSQGSGVLTVDGQDHPAYVLYTRIYSLNAADIQFYNQPLGVTTDWVAFWDTSGNFYHVDATQVDLPTAIYQSHQIGVWESPEGSVTKTFDLIINRDGNMPPHNYTISLSQPINVTLSLSRSNDIDKDPSGAHNWFLGNLAGTVTLANGEELNGVGIAEYIHD